MKNIKAVFFGVDGTLVDQMNKMQGPHESTLKAFDALKKKGILVVAASGRTPVSVGHVTDYPFDGFVSANGSLIYVQGKKTYTGGLTPKEVRFLWDYFVENKIGFMMQGDGINIYHDEQDFGIKSSLARMRNVKSNTQVVFGNGDVEEGTVFKFVVFYPSIGLREKAERDFKGKFYNMHYTQFGENPGIIHLSGEITSLKDTKGSGIKHFLDYLDIKSEEAMAFGDNSNDIEMFEVVDGYAMEEAVQALKDKAVEVIGPVNSDTIYQLLKRKGIID